MKRRIAAVLCIAALALSQVLFVMPEFASAETFSGKAGEVLSVRVQYAGEREDKIREKVSYTAEELKGMNSAVYRYTNVTNVGTVMQIIAVGPRLLDVIEAAGVDINSIKMITFKTDDGYTRNFDVGKHLTSTRYYYPNLPKNYERNGDARTLIPLEGSLADAQTVPSILALKCESTKSPNRVLTEDDMKLEEAFRFCLGQPPLQEGLETVSGYEGGDVTAMESAQFISAVDITLYGSPVKGIGLNLEDTDLKVGSKKQISAVIEGDELFADEFGFTVEDLIWSSSAPDIVSVSEDGTIAVLKEGTAVITAEAPNGMTASVTINASKDAEEKEEAPAKKEEPQNQLQGDSDSKDNGKGSGTGQGDGTSDNKKDLSDKKTEKVTGIVVKEVTLEEVVPENVGSDAGRKEMAADAQALDEAEKTNPVTVFLSGYTAVLAAGFGAAFRVRRYYKEV